MFGGVEALVQSQDWWLRDQANLFGNWMNVGGSPQDTNIPASSPTLGTGIDATTDLDNIAGIGSGYYAPPSNGNGKRSGDTFSDDWNF